MKKKRWRETVHHTQFHAYLEQLRDARSSDDSGVHLMEALYTAIRSHTCTTCTLQHRERTYLWEVKCSICKEEDDLREHQCYIQPVEEGGKPPLFVYADIKAMTLPDRTFQPNLLCYETSHGKKGALWGKTCCKDFIMKLNEMAWVPAGKKKMKERPPHTSEFGKWSPKNKITLINTPIDRWTQK